MPNLRGEIKSDGEKLGFRREDPAVGSFRRLKTKYHQKWSRVRLSTFGSKLFLAYLY